MSKIKELLNDKDSILVFDVDGVLAKIEWGEYNHYTLTDEEWNKACSNGKNYYTENVVFKKMQKFLENKNTNNIYVITTVGTENEGKFKKEYVNKYYNILKENVYYVKNNLQKKEALKKIKNKYNKINDNQIIMIDDTVDVLTDIMENTNFSTVHVSSFLDI